MLSTKSSSAVRTAVNALQNYKVLNILINDYFEKASETEEKLSSNEKKSNRSFFLRIPSIIDEYIFF